MSVSPSVQFHPIMCFTYVFNGHKSATVADYNEQWILVRSSPFKNIMQFYLESRNKLCLLLRNDTNNNNLVQVEKVAYLNNSHYVEFMTVHHHNH